ncbi:Ras-related protein Rab-3 [Eumeta japonica]|uniref:Ras-related protein Rab-3 n=1 Tax=Eumeta variegata TaxID=151549 RepID=A0A4C1TKH2_EUMVA|nr:Ras-related protein Rab-3 [Eumeta japonica]
MGLPLIVIGLIHVKLRLPCQKKNRTNYTNKNTSQLKNIDEITKYKENLSSFLSEKSSQPATQENEPVQTAYDNITKAIQQSLTLAKRTTEGNKKHKILQESTLKLLKRRQELQQSKNKTRSMKKELSALYKLVHKYIKKDYAKYRLETIEKYLQLYGSSGRAYKELRTNRSWIEGLKTLNKDIHIRTDIVSTATEFYKNLYSTTHEARMHARVHECTKARISTNKIETETADYHSIQPIHETEVINSISKIKLEKSPRSDNVPNEALKYAHQILATPLTELFNSILISSETPKEWSEANIILIYKKGDPKNISNYRPISLLPNIYKLFSSIINNRLSPIIEAKQPIEQAGFRKGYSTIDHIHTIELIIEKYQELQRPLYITLHHYQKAFASVTHSSIWESLKEHEVPDLYLNIIKSIYNTNIGRIKLETLGPAFHIERGVRQGDPFSPTIFIAILESIMNRVTQIKTYSWDNAQVILVGNKCDMEDERVVSSERGRQLAEQLGVEFYETSAKENINVKAVFERLVDIICDKMSESLDSEPAMMSSGARGQRLTEQPQGSSNPNCNC